MPKELLVLLSTYSWSGYIVLHSPSFVCNSRKYSTYCSDSTRMKPEYDRGNPNKPGPTYWVMQSNATIMSI